MTAEANVSHGRGGQGNIGPDETKYTDGEIHREGDPTATGGAYSAGVSYHHHHIIINVHHIFLHIRLPVMGIASYKQTSCIGLTT
ncbi:hypothetical protein K440DRAFT_617047 [Wilcoxina mikolae CBS 423.85]|nr:hypothetical protein K440DRAFT_617047 [Wilcoxina mikolae CBS 423.85]